MPKYPSIFNRDNPLEPPEHLAPDHAHLERYNTHIEIYERESDEKPYEIYIPVDLEEKGGTPLGEYLQGKLDEIGIDPDEIDGYQLKHGRGRSMLFEEWEDLSDYGDDMDANYDGNEYAQGGGMIITMR